LALALTAGGAAGQKAPPVVVVIGDSLSSGYGVPAGEGWVDLLQRKLQAERYRHRVVNASITGDTTAGGRSRIDALLAQHAPAVVIVELGGNDGLRGGSLDAMRDNLAAMIAASKRAGAKVLLVGMQLPPNYGPQYTQRFREVYAELAKAHALPLVASLVDGFGEKLELFQPDRIHPLPAAQPRMLDNVWPKLKPLLGKTAA
jgi:acyl-CoA thioesterase-1